MTEAGLVRAFLALEVPESARERIGRLVHDLRANVGGLRWSSLEALHLTLRFLGPSSPPALARLGQELGPAAGRCPPAEVPLGSLGLFPEQGSPRVLWLGVALPPEMLELQKACERAAVQAGFAREARPFRSHLTLGRWRERARRPELPAGDLGHARLETLTLFRSDLSPRGAAHTPLARFPLG